MTLNLIKLCVGAKSVEEHQAWIALVLDEKRRLGQPVEQRHTTRMMPRRAQELLDAGSLYWVIKGQVQCRQRLLAIRPFTDDKGIARCHLVLEPKATLTRFQPRRPFQGWRYLSQADAPADLGKGESAGDDMPHSMRMDLAALGLM